MYTLPVLISFLVSVVFPFVASPWIPQIFLDKGIEANALSYPTLYICLLAIWLIWMTRHGDLRFIDESAADRNCGEYKLAIWLIVCIWCLRVAYFTFERDSIYIDAGSNTLSLINYVYVEIVFRLYPLVLILILLNIQKKIALVFLIFEILYGVLIFSKFIVIIAIIGGLYLWKEKLKLFLYQKRFFIPSIIGFFLFFGFVALHGSVSELRLQGNSFSRIDFDLFLVTSNAISRLQSISSIFFAEQILSEYLYGKSFCTIFGFLVPDSLYSLPHTCRNIDEDIKLFYLGVVDHRIINKDFLSFWGEPYANFGVLGFVVIVGYCWLAKTLIDGLGRNRFGLSLYAVFLINTLISHQSMSLSVRNLLISFIFLWILQQLSMLRIARA